MKKFFLKQSGFARFNVIGRFVLAPIIYFSYVFIFNRGNSNGLKYVDEYINNSVLIEVVVPKIPLYNEKTYGFYHKLDSYRDEFNGLKYVNRNTAYSERYKKYVTVIMFEGYEYYYAGDSKYDMAGKRCASFFYFGNRMLVRANKVQLQDSHYGSLQNPVPVFFYCFVSGKRRFKGPDSDYDPKNPLHVALDSVNTDFNRLYVEKYLTRIIDVDELTRLYGKR
ncbi:hypothetical protein JCM15754A_12070 [Prevotella aurantiaca JCM 15754]|mgnify:CR=1 FL=1|jgi:hypothetical protein|uniref:DUF8188 domain-containing protein n=2 Tax=Prevotella aurantiaca TaxID=596085 RepID=A0A930N0M1_9BACT|nr:hypothetical protein [Prevotella aurantiaca]MBF1383772.1 hypothetical protein [Prevotella aurantiaca]MBF1386324.1 hypothetical protein [Prevotella aurantiaca]